MPFAGVAIPSIQLGILESYLKEKKISVSSRHLYLKAADFYGLDNYNLLINTPNDSYSAQLIFSKYVFPDHWCKNFDRFKKYFNEKISKYVTFSKDFTFEDFSSRTDKFLKWVIENIDWNFYDIIGFSLNYGQFLPSLAVSKEIKNLFPEKKIIFGGSRCVGKIGEKMLEAFEYIDFIVTGEGETPLYLLASNPEECAKIPRLIYRQNGKIISNTNDDYIEMDNLPMPTFDAFYKELSSSSKELNEYFSFVGRIPIEISRGCWWNKCTFCNLNVQHSKYGEKSVEKIINEINFLSEKYENTNFQIISNTMLLRDYKLFLEKISEIPKDFDFLCEIRPGRFEDKDYSLLKKAGFNTIQMGIETFSQNYMKKMNKGFRVIDGVAALKFCKEEGIANKYNIIINFPNEEKIDFQETKNNINLFKQFLDPPQISNLMVGYCSKIYDEYKNYNISSLNFTEIDNLMFPQEILKKNISYFFTFEIEHVLLLGENQWENLVESWVKDWKNNIAQSIEVSTTLNKLIFYYVDGEKFLKIFDKRQPDDIKAYILDETERRIFLSCLNVISIEKIKEKINDISEEEIDQKLNLFEQYGIVLREDSYYLVLPLRYSKVI